MADPTNKSVQGVINWVKAANDGTGHAANDVNANTLDGKHYSEVIADAAANAGGGCIAFSGATTYNFAGNGNYTTVNFTPALTDINKYFVTITPKADGDSRIGEYWVVKQTGGSFRVYNDGSSTAAFDWSVGIKGPLSGVSYLDDLGDVTITSPQTGQSLVLNAGGQWVNGSPTVTVGGITSAYTVTYISSSGNSHIYAVNIPAGAKFAIVVQTARYNTEDEAQAPSPWYIIYNGGGEAVGTAFFTSLANAQAGTNPVIPTGDSEGNFIAPTTLTHVVFYTSNSRDYAGYAYTGGSTGVKPFRIVKCS